MLGTALPCFRETGSVQSFSNLSISVAVVTADRQTVETMKETMFALYSIPKGIQLQGHEPRWWFTLTIELHNNLKLGS